MEYLLSLQVTLPDYTSWGTFYGSIFSVPMDRKGKAGSHVFPTSPGMKGILCFCFHSLLLRSSINGFLSSGHATSD